MNTYNTLLNIIIVSNIILLIIAIITLIIRLYMLSKSIIRNLCMNVRNLYMFVRRCIRKIAMRKYKANYPHVTGQCSEAFGITYTKEDCDDKHSHFILYA